MSRKTLSFLRAYTAEGAVRLTCYKVENIERRMFDKIRVYRLETPDFTFTSDYSEFFDGLDYRQAKLILDGPLECTNDLKFTFIDRNVTIGSTYAYWMAGVEGDPTGPIPIKVRDPQIWWTNDKLKAKLVALEALAPQCVQEQKNGESVRRMPI